MGIWLPFNSVMYPDIPWLIAPVCDFLADLQAKIVKKAHMTIKRLCRMLHFEW